MRIAITRQVSSGIARCELSHLRRETIDVEVAQAQHRRYERCLKRLGCEVRSLPSEPSLPDSVFVEDAAVVFDEFAIVTRPGAESRRPETSTVADALKPWRELIRIEEPGTLDGGDVLQVGRNVYVGRSSRSNDGGFRQARDVLRSRGYSVARVPVKGCLHLKSAVTRVAEDTLLLNRRWVSADFFHEFRIIDIDPAEPFAANALLVGETVVYPRAFERTLVRLRDAGVEVAPVDVSELAKAEGGVTCCSLVFEG